jgi:hypothetical protein
MWPVSKHSASRNKTGMHTMFAENMSELLRIAAVLLAIAVAYLIGFEKGKNKR